MTDKTVPRHLYRVGVLLKHRPVDERATWRFEPGRGRLEAALQDVFGDGSVGDGSVGDARGGSTSVEAVALSTCARSEIYVASTEPCSGTQLRELFARMATCLPCSFSLEIQRDEDVILRLFHVATGLESPLRGEGEILGQLRRAFEQGVLARRGSLLRGLGQRAIATGRAARRQSGLRIDYATAIAARLERIDVGSPPGLRIGVVGSGRFAARLADGLRSHGHDVELFTQHPQRQRQGQRQGLKSLSTLEASLRDAQTWQHRPHREISPGRARSTDALAEHLPHLDVLVTAARGSQTVLSTEVIQHRFRPLTIIDLGVPPNVDRSVAGGAPSQVTYLALDELTDTATSPALERASTLVRRRAAAFAEAWQRRQQLAGRRLVLAAHGAGSSSDVNRVVGDLADQLRQRLGRLPIDTAFHLGEPGFESANDESALVLPLLTSRGYFYRRLESAVDEAELLPPIGEDPRTHAAITRALLERVGDRRQDQLGVIVVGHGTRRNAASGDTTRHLAEVLSQALPSAHVVAAFLDQEPGLRKIATELAKHVQTIATVPFLLGYASHAREDIDTAVSDLAVERLDAPPLLDLPSLPHLLTAIVTDRRRPPRLAIQPSPTATWKAQLPAGRKVA